MANAYTVNKDMRKRTTIEMIIKSHDKLKEKVEKHLLKQNKKVQVIGVNNNIPSSQNVQEMKNVFINSPKEYGENLLKRINIFFIFCSIQFKARFEYDK